MSDIPSLSTYLDWFNKAEFDFERLKKSNEIYDFVDCLLTLNALPDWIIKSDQAPPNLKQIAEDKNRIMSGDDNRFQLDESKLDNDIDHQLRFIRFFCNHAKHGGKKQIPIIIKRFGGALPAAIPIVFTVVIEIGAKQINAQNLISDVIQFWEGQLN